MAKIKSWERIVTTTWLLFLPLWPLNERIVNGYALFCHLNWSLRRTRLHDSLPAINERMLTHTNDRRCKIDLNVSVIVSSTLLFATLARIRGGNACKIKSVTICSSMGNRWWRILHSFSSLRNAFALRIPQDVRFRVHVFSSLISMRISRIFTAYSKRIRQDHRGGTLHRWFTLRFLSVLEIREPSLMRTLRKPTRYVSLS